MITMKVMLPCSVWDDDDDDDNCVGVNNRKVIHIRALISNSHNKTNERSNVKIM
jgi:hypothetical protein